MIRRTLILWLMMVLTMAVGHAIAADPAPAPALAAPAATSPATPATASTAAQPYKAEAGPHQVDVLTFDWHDAKRNRAVPVKIYLPRATPGRPSAGRERKRAAPGAESPAETRTKGPAETPGQAGPWPVIIFSHGLGGSRDGYEYLGRHWAGHGYVSVHLQHIGSDTAVWKDAQDRMGAMRKAVANLDNSMQRPRDVSFAINRLTEMNAAPDGPLAGRLDLERLGMAGHSFGAWTTLAVAGQVFAGREPRFRDERVKAAIPMSAPAAPPLQRAKAYSAIRIPMFHMTGTQDTSPIGDTTAAERRIPFDHIDGAEQVLLTFTGGDHMVFSGRPRAWGGGENDKRFQNLILQSTTAFWDAYLRGDAAAKAWLAEGGFKAVLGAAGTFETKQPKTPPTPKSAERVQADGTPASP